MREPSKRRLIDAGDDALGNRGYSRAPGAVPDELEHVEHGRGRPHHHVPRRGGVPRVLSRTLKQVDELLGDRSRDAPSQTCSGETVRDDEVHTLAENRDLPTQHFQRRRQRRCAASLFFFGPAYAVLVWHAGAAGEADVHGSGQPEFDIGLGLHVDELVVQVGHLRERRTTNSERRRRGSS